MKNEIIIQCPHCGCDNDDQLEMFIPVVGWIAIKELRYRRVLCNQCSKEFKFEGKK